MRKYILSAILFVICFSAFSGDVPGFRGKRFFVQYQCGIMHPVITARTGKLPMFNHQLALDYTMSRSWTIGVKYGFMWYKAPTDAPGFYAGGDYYRDGGDPKDFPGVYMQHTVGFYAKKFLVRKGYIAPVGRYIILGLYYQHVIDHITSLSANYNSGSSTDTYTAKGYKGKAFTGGVTVGIGRNVVIARRMLFDVNFCVNLTPPLREFLDGSKQQEAVWRDLFFRNLVQVNIGFGGLLF
jgi:hypothetical protein